MSENNGICDVEAIKKFNYPKWTGWDLFRRHLTSEGMGGGEPYLDEYKDGYIVFHRDRIKQVAARYKIPAFLLAGIAWSEAGGKPDNWKYGVWLGRRVGSKYRHPIYRFGQDISPLVPKGLKEPPENTSFGIIAMQVRVAADMVGANAHYLPPLYSLSPPVHPFYTPPLCHFCSPHYPPSMEMQAVISNCLMMDVFNIEIVARHLRDLILYDYPHADTLNLTTEQIILAASRYNRGIERKKADFLKSMTAPSVFKREDDPEGWDLREYSSNGRALVRHRIHIQELLQ